MSMLSVRVPQVQPFSALARVVAVIAAVFEVFAEAQQQAIAADRRYPFIDR